MKFDVIAFDADDTLWQNESLYRETEARFAKLLAPYHNGQDISEQLFTTEMRNLERYGYGIKPFALSMIETAVTVSDGRISSRDIQKIINFAKEILASPTKLFDHVAEVVTNLAQFNTLMLITKGDLLDQEAKLARSGLADYFSHVEVVSHKTSATYAKILSKYQIESQQFLMVGNSLKSDILPVVEVGGTAVYIPQHLTWAHETVSQQEREQNNYHELEHIGLLPNLLSRLS